MNEQYYSDLPSDSPLNDPARIKLLLSSRDRHQEMKSTIDKQKELISKLSAQCTQLGSSSQRASAMEDLNLRLQEEIESMRSELNEMRSGMTSDMKNYDALRTKIKRIEQGYAKREKDLQALIRNKDKVGTEFDSMLQLMYSL